MILETQQQSPKIYTTQFWLVCLSSLLFFASFNMLIPELPSYLTSLGGASYKGLIISLFTITAMTSRPFSGKMADKVGRIPVMIIGTSVCVVSSLMYPLLTSVSAFLILRLVHGFSTGFTPTGLTAYLADVIPAQKRGEAMGLLGTAGSVGMAVGPVVGAAVANNLGLNAMFYTSSGFALTSILILSGIKETLNPRNKFSRDALRINKRDLFEPRVLVTCLVMLFTAYSFGAAYTILPDFGEFVGIHNKGLLFTFLTVASLSVRLVAGKASDRFGRRNVLMVSTSITSIAMLMLGFGSTPRDLMIAITLYGLSQGMNSPTLFAWATDLSNEKYRGRAISSLYIFMEMGIGVGAFTSGLIFGNDPSNFLITFMVCSAFAAMAFFYLLFFGNAHSDVSYGKKRKIIAKRSIGSLLDQI